MKRYKNIRGSYYEDLHLTGHKSQSWFYRSREQYLLSFAKIKRSDTVLDIGCGSGMVTRKIAEKVGCRVIGVDRSEDCIQHANKRSKNKKNIKFVVGSMENLPFMDNKFDVIIASHIIEHLKDPENALCEVRKKLKKSGRLIITTPNYKSLWPIAEFIFDRTLAESDYSLHDQHVTKFDSKNVESLLNRLNFRKVSVESHYIITLPISLLSSRLADFIFSFEKILSSLPFGTILYVEGSKDEK